MGQALGDEAALRGEREGARLPVGADGEHRAVGAQAVGARFRVEEDEGVVRFGDDDRPGAGLERDFPGRGRAVGGGDDQVRRRAGEGLAPVLREPGEHGGPGGGPAEEVAGAQEEGQGSGRAGKSEAMFHAPYYAGAVPFAFKFLL